MSYLRSRSLSERQNELRELIDERLRNEEAKIRQRVYQWLSNNQYFVDNELFDFYFCVAQNLAAVEVLGGSGEKILQAKAELEKSAFVYITQVKDISEEVNQKLQHQLHSVQESQEKLDFKLNQVLEGLIIERENLKTISTGLVNSTVNLLDKQKQLLVQTEAAKKFIFQSVVIAWILPILTFVLWLAITIII